MRAHRRVIVGSKALVCRGCRTLLTASKHDAPERRPSQKLPPTPARTRFAPSPTGYLHLGSLRTALFNYLTARATGGQFILRIEDTDKKRTVGDAESRLYQDLKWTGLQWDEGPDVGGSYGPYKQSERTLLYQKHATELLDSGHAYRCFCSTERLNVLATERYALGLPIDYDRACTGVPKEESDDRASKREPHVVRLKVPDVPAQYTDLVYGVIGQRRKTEKPQSQRAQPSYEDPVLVKSDGRPTYHLANVVDDHHMGITHVIRAVEWMASTPKHMVMYNAFGWKPPTFAHVGLLQDSSRQKFSKRDLALDVRSFREDGIFPEALVNYVSLYGWSHRLGDDFLSLQDLVKNFDLKFTKGNTIATPNKLIHLQKRYAQKYANENGDEYETMIEGVVVVAQQHLEAHPETKFCRIAELRGRAAALLRLDAATYTTPREFFERNSQFFCFEARKEYSLRLDDLLLKGSINRIEGAFSAVTFGEWEEPKLKQVSENLVECLLPKWETDQSKDPVKDCRNALNRFLRWALTGGRPGLTVMSTMVLLGRDESVRRIEDAAASFRYFGQGS